MPMQRSDFANLMAPGLWDVFYKKYSQYPDEYSVVFPLETSKRKYEDIQTLATFGTVPEKAEGTSITYDVASQRYKTTFTHTGYGLGFRITKEAQDDDLYAVLGKPLAGELGKVFKDKVETTAANIFNNAFNASYTGADGKPLCATDHPLVSGTQSNRLAVDSDLTVTSLRSAIEIMEKTKNDRGILVRIQPKLLIVPTEEQWTAYELLGSEWKPGTANNEVNAFLTKDLAYFVYHYLTDTDAWFLSASKEDTGLLFFWRTKPEFSWGNDFDTMDAKYKGFMRFSVGWYDFRGIVGTPGA